MCNRSLHVFLSSERNFRWRDILLTDSIKGGPNVEVFSAQGNAASCFLFWKQSSPHIQREFDKDLKVFIWTGNSFLINFSKELLLQCTKKFYSKFTKEWKTAGATHPSVLCLPNLFGNSERFLVRYCHNSLINLEWFIVNWFGVSLYHLMGTFHSSIIISELRIIKDRGKGWFCQQPQKILK